jgi:ABC-type branched-subunit amino acid transport system substrate-binding protein
MRTASLFLLQAFSLCSAVNVLHIGGLFSIFNKQGEINRAQLEHASVFLQAINEINKNSAILPNHELQVVMGGGADSLEVAVSLNQMFQTSSFVGAVSALDNTMGGYATKLFGDANLMIVNSMTTDTSFGDASLYPLKAQTVPISSYQGKLHQSIHCSVNITRGAIFTTDNMDGIRYATEMTEGTYCKMNILGHFAFPDYTTDFTEILREAVSSDARVFFIAVASPVTLRDLLVQGHESGLFRDGTQVLATEIHGFDEVLAELDDAVAEIITKGLLITEYSPDYPVQTTTRGKKFYASWLNQTSLGNCSTTVDSVGNKYLHRTSGGRESCASLNFSSYKSGASSLDPYAVLTYDAAYTLAWGLHHALDKGQSLTATNLSRTIIDEVDFVGASGHVNIFEGDAAFSMMAKGNREVGNYYKLSEFRFSRYLSAPGHSFIPQLLYSADAGWSLCPSTLLCLPYEHIFHEGWQGGYPPYAFATAPAIVKIGGLFSAFVDGGPTMDKENAELLAMFLMAVREINNKTDGVHDDLLPNTQLMLSVENSASTAFSGANSYNDIKNSFFRSGVSGIVNTLSSNLVKSINAYAQEDETFQVLSRAQDADLSDGLQYSFKASTIPLDTFIGSLFQDTLCVSKVEKIAILSEDNAFGMGASIDLLNTRHSGCPLRALAHVSFATTTTDFSSILDEVAKSGAQIFVIFAGAAPTASLLIEGRQRKVFRSGTVLLTSESHSLTGELQLNHNLDKETIASVMRGVLSASFFPEYGVKYTDLGKAFSERFLKFGARRSSSYSAYCKKFDDSGERMLLRNSDTKVGCAELNYSSYLSGDAELGPYATMTYDATYALAWSIHDALSAGTHLTGKNLRDTMYASVAFEGVSGMINITDGTHFRAGYNQGTRLNGVHYLLLNFNEEVYLGGGIDNDGFVPILLWSLEDGMVPCPPDIVSYPIVFDNKPSNVPPSDSRPPIWLEFDHATRVFFYVLGALVIFLSVVFLLQTIRFRALAEVQNSQEHLLYCILVGGLLAGGRVINAGLPLSDKTCVAGFWLGNLSFWFAVMAFFLKSWRVNQLLAIKSIKRVRITTAQIMSYMFLSLLFVVGMLVILTVVGEPSYGESVTESANQETLVPYCPMVHPEVQTVLYVIYALLLGTGLRLCWSLREVPKKFSDFHTIGSG